MHSYFRLSLLRQRSMSHVLNTDFLTCLFWLCLIASIKRFSLADLLIIVIEDTMQISEIKLEMELNGVDAADIAEIIEQCKAKGLSNELLDEALVLRGYEKIFSVNYDDYDDWDEWGEDEYSSVEKFPYKKSYSD